jgi:hypothetical protein
MTGGRSARDDADFDGQGGTSLRIQLNGSTAKLRTAPIPSVCSAVVEGSFGTAEPLASFPSTFAVGQAPIVTTY